MDRMEFMFESDPAVSHLYFETFRRQRFVEPEKELILAILADALECFRKHYGCRQGPGMKLFQEAKDWIFDDDEKDTFSFLNVCNALDLDPCYIRRGIVNVKSDHPGGETERKIRKRPLQLKKFRRNQGVTWWVNSRARGHRLSRVK